MLVFCIVALFFPFFSLISHIIIYYFMYYPSYTLLYLCTIKWIMIVIRIIAFHQISFFAHMTPEFFFLIISCFKFFAKSTLLYTSSKMFRYMNNFLGKNSSRDISLCNIIPSLFYVFILIYYLIWYSSLILPSEDIKTKPTPRPG